jgi:hypothetical protein
LAIDAAIHGELGAAGIMRPERSQFFFFVAPNDFPDSILATDQHGRDTEKKRNFLFRVPSVLIRGYNSCVVAAPCAALFPSATLVLSRFFSRMLVIYADSIVRPRISPSPRTAQTQFAGFAQFSLFDSAQRCARIKSKGLLNHGLSHAEGDHLMWYYKSEHPLRRFFSGITEHTFMDTLGMGDPRLVDYLSILLSRFIHMDTVTRLSNGQNLEQVADMLQEAQALPPGATSREVHRHIGDFTLFWTGVYPEALRRLRCVVNKDHFINYCEQGKRSYYIASTFENDPYREEAPVLRRLSEQFELCAYGLGRVREEWEKSQGQTGITAE